MTHFTQYPFIDPAHQPILDKVVDSHAANTDSRLLAVLYREAQDGLKGIAQTKPVGVLSHFASADIKVATVTDPQTGAYLQLATVPGQRRAMLTVGQKWAMESPNGQVGNVATILW